MRNKWNIFSMVVCQNSIIIYDFFFVIKPPTEITIYNVQRAVTTKVCEPELWFLCSASRHIVEHISVKFHEII